MSSSLSPTAAGVTSQEWSTPAAPTETRTLASVCANVPRRVGYRSRHMPSSLAVITEAPKDGELSWSSSGSSPKNTTPVAQKILQTSPAAGGGTPPTTSVLSRKMAAVVDENDKKRSLPSTPSDPDTKSLSSSGGGSSSDHSHTTPRTRTGHSPEDADHSSSDGDDTPRARSPILLIEGDPSSELMHAEVLVCRRRREDHDEDGLRGGRGSTSGQSSGVGSQRVVAPPVVLASAVDGAWIRADSCRAARVAETIRRAAERVSNLKHSVEGGERTVDREWDHIPNEDEEDFFVRRDSALGQDDDEVDHDQLSRSLERARSSTARITASRDTVRSRTSSRYLMVPPSPQLHDGSVGSPLHDEQSVAFDISDAAAAVPFLRGVFTESGGGAASSEEESGGGSSSKATSSSSAESVEKIFRPTGAVASSSSEESESSGSSGRAGDSSGSGEGGQSGSEDDPSTASDASAPLLLRETPVVSRTVRPFASTTVRPFAPRNSSSNTGGSESVGCAGSSSSNPPTDSEPPTESDHGVDNTKLSDAFYSSSEGFSEEVDFCGIRRAHTSSKELLRLRQRWREQGDTGDTGLPPGVVPKEGTEEWSCSSPELVCGPDKQVKYEGTRNSWSLGESVSLGREGSELCHSELGRDLRCSNGETSWSSDIQKNEKHSCRRKILVIIHLKKLGGGENEFRSHGRRHTVILTT